MVTKKNHLKFIFLDPTGEEFVKSEGVTNILNALRVSMVPVQLQVLNLLHHLIIYGNVTTKQIIL
jgi:hypothetical protein